MITDVPGVRVGHWTGTGTGVTVVLAPSGSIGGGEVRGAAPATRETDVLLPGRLVERVDAVVLTGGSAFGLATAHGVMSFLAERGQGYPTSGGPVPIVVAAAIFDLPVAGSERPTAADGYAAAVAAERGEPWATGPVGAGRGATVGKWRGGNGRVPGGIGAAVAVVDGCTVGALAVVNAVGDVVTADGAVLAGADPTRPAFPDPRPYENTTLVVIATDAALDRSACHLVAQSGHDGIARAVNPAHTRYDGDAVFSLATGERTVDVRTVDRIRADAVDVVAAAIRASVTR